MTLLFPKPRRQDRPGEIRKRDIRRKDRQLSKETETYVCEECGATGKTDPAHVVPRRFQLLRHDRKNVKRKCRRCHRKERYNLSDQRQTILEAYR